MQYIPTSCNNTMYDFWLQKSKLLMENNNSIQNIINQIMIEDRKILKVSF